MIYNGLNSNSWYTDLETSSDEFDDNEIELDLGNDHPDDLSYIFIVPILVICVGTLIYRNMYRCRKYVKCLKDDSNELTNGLTNI